jgi:hypothetical protein
MTCRTAGQKSGSTARPREVLCSCSCA